MTYQTHREPLPLEHRESLSSEPLRIVHAVRSDAFAGVERSILLSASALSARGHSVAVIGGHNAFMAAHLSAIGVNWFPAASTLDVVRQLRRLPDPDVLHAHMTAAEAAALLGYGRARPALVVTRHFAAPRGATPAGRLVAFALRHVPHAEIAISAYVAGAIGVPSTLVPHGTFDERLSDPVQHRIVIVQRLEPEKCTAVGIEAFARTGLARSGWTLDIAGDGRERSALVGLAASLGVSHAVRFAGRLQDTSGFRRYAAAQLATCPDEHFGLSVLEAMAAGLPVVSAAGGAQPALLGHQPELLFTPGDADAAAACLTGLADDLALRRRIGAALQQRQQALFSVDAHGLALERVYRSAVAAA